VNGWSGVAPSGIDAPLGSGSGVAAADDTVKAAIRSRACRELPRDPSRTESPALQFPVGC